MHTRILAISFLASAGRGQWPRSWAQARARFHEMRVAAWTRRLLSGMDARMLRDIGIGPADAQAEAERWPWDLGPPQQ